MFFRVLGHILRWAWGPFLVAWALLLVVTWLAAPPFQDVAQDREFAFLPADAPSRRAEEVYHKAFPDDHYTSNIVLVVHRGEATRGHRDRDLKFIADVLEPALWKIVQAEGGLA